MCQTLRFLTEGLVFTGWLLSGYVQESAQLTPAQSSIQYQEIRAGLCMLLFTVLVDVEGFLSEPFDFLGGKDRYRFIRRFVFLSLGVHVMRFLHHLHTVHGIEFDDLVLLQIAEELRKEQIGLSCRRVGQSADHHIVEGVLDILDRDFADRYVAELRIDLRDRRCL